jgi:hypothetical protein
VLAIDSGPDKRGGMVWYDCAGPDDPYPTVGLPAGVERQDPVALTGKSEKVYQNDWLGVQKRG